MWLRADFCGLTSNFNFSDPDGPGGGAGWNPVDPRSFSCICVDARSFPGLVRERPLLETACRAQRLGQWLPEAGARG